MSVNRGPQQKLSPKARLMARRLKQILRVRKRKSKIEILKLGEIMQIDERE